MSFLPPYPAPFPAAAPEALGFDPARLAEAVAFAGAHESPFPRDLLAHLEGGHFEPAPDNELLGPVVPRGAPNGLVLRDGVLAARWGDTRRADMTFSVAKSCLSILAGLAVQDGLIADLDARVSASVDDPAFSGPRNGAITWRMLLQQTSEWEGTLFGKADQIDRGRDLASEGKKPKGWPRPLAEPGGHWEYNDVRVNVLSLALLHRFGRALPEVWKERVADPIGSSPDWRWEGYRNAAVEIGGRPVVSVPGGGHWGGGIVTDAEDQARIGLLMLNDGTWAGQRILPEGWVAESGRPVALHPDYGLLWWLNRSGRFPDADRDSLLAVGAGGNTIWIEPATRIVAVFRWLDPQALAGMISRISAARTN
ncbi:serine hydrolase domain-containing protein [Pararoseomonas indoligenes]|uniref:Serine hydrolase n=1 Tax=Roseomonas indoligenes TaxID=2820811 RepID=A0A940N1Q3_9PROT|nr:serine hydrolase domain-containing protein [Pararoseomonas indoligenes]MBP0492637.1 serine hydrolase [Pararoseomonas indoligenes]